MRSNDVQGELAEGFEPGPLPPMDQDGGMTAPEPAPEPVPMPPRLCEQGPCAHYHAFTIVMDAAKPRGDRVSDAGHVEGAAPEVSEKVETHHYCYPTTGIETVLGSLPILQCNRWAPSPPEQDPLELKRQRYLATPAGQKYQAELERWAKHQDELKASEDAQIEEAQREFEAAERERLERKISDFTGRAPASGDGPVVAGEVVVEATEPAQLPDPPAKGEP